MIFLNSEFAASNLQRSNRTTVFELTLVTIFCGSNIKSLARKKVKASSGSCESKIADRRSTSIKIFFGYWIIVFHSHILILTREAKASRGNCWSKIPDWCDTSNIFKPLGHSFPLPYDSSTPVMHLILVKAKLLGI